MIDLVKENRVLIVVICVLCATALWVLIGGVHVLEIRSEPETQPGPIVIYSRPVDQKDAIRCSRCHNR